MKIKRLAAAVIAVASVLSCVFPAYADDDDEEFEHPEVYEYYTYEDGSPMTGLCYTYYCPDLNGMDYGEENFSGLNDSRKRMIELGSDGLFLGVYSGYTTNAEGKRYYIYGKRVYGWVKTKDGWRHFDRDGYMSTGKTEICGANYYFDDDGVWTEKYSKSGKAPEDFNIEYRVNSFGNSIGFNTEKSEIYYEECDTVIDGVTKYGDTTVNAKISNADKQALYCMFLESGISEENMPAELDEKYLYDFMDKHNKDENGYIKKFREKADYCYSVTVSADGKTYSLSFYDFICQLASMDEASGAAVFFADGLEYYYYVLEEKYPQTFGG